MKLIDEIRGFEREIKFNAAGYATGSGVPLTNCVVEVVEIDWQGRCPMLSLRFFHRPIPSHVAEERVRASQPAYDEDTVIGVEINLGPEITQSLVEQLQAKLPEYTRITSDGGGTETNE